MRRIDAVERDRKRIREMFPDITKEEWDNQHQLKKSNSQYITASSHRFTSRIYPQCTLDNIQTKQVLYQY